MSTAPFLRFSGGSTSAPFSRRYASARPSRERRSRGVPESRSRRSRWRSNRSWMPGSCASLARRPRGPSYGAVYFESVPEAALVLGLDLGARFLRGAICDLAGEVRARQDLELRAADVDEALTAAAALRDSLVETSGLDGDLIDSAVVGVPGVVEVRTGKLSLAANVQGLEGRALADDLRARLGLPVTLENDINLAALGERWPALRVASRTSSSSRSGRAWAPGSCSRASCTAGAMGGRRGRLRAAGPRERGGSFGARDLGACRPARTRGKWADRRCPAFRRSRPVRGRPRRRSAGAGSGTGGGSADRVAHRPDRRGGRRRPRRPRWRHRGKRRPPARARSQAPGRLAPYPPRIETSSLGEAAVLMGALAVGSGRARQRLREPRRRGVRVVAGLFRSARTWARCYSQSSGRKKTATVTLTGSALGIRPKARIRTPTRCGARGEELSANRFLRGASLLLVSSVLVGRWARSTAAARVRTRRPTQFAETEGRLAWPEWRSGAGVKGRKCGRGG